MRRDRISELLAVGEEYGHRIGRDLARRWFETYGFDGACEQIAMADRLIGTAALELHERLGFAAAERLLARSRRDFTAASRRLRVELACRSSSSSCPTPEELRAAADELGWAIGRKTARRYAEDPSCDPLDRFDKLARVRDAGSRRGLRIDLGSAAARLARAGGDVEQAIERIERRARRQQRAQSRLCDVPRRSGPRGDWLDAVARCGCRSCFPRLSEELAPYTRAILERHCRRHCPADERHETMEDLRQEANEVLYRALIEWPGRSGFTAFYGAALGNWLNGGLRRLLAEKRGSGVRPLRLDAPVARDGGGASLIDRLPSGESLDPLIIVLLKERIEEARAARRADAAWVAEVYDLLNRHV